mgnify:CR=1 FL=1
MYFLVVPCPHYRQDDSFDAITQDQVTFWVYNKIIGERMDQSDDQVASATHAPTGQSYSTYKDRLTLLERIDTIERFALPYLRTRHQKQARLVQHGRGNPQKTCKLEKALQAAENDLVNLKSRLST